MRAGAQSHYNICNQIVKILPPNSELGSEIWRAAAWSGGDDNKRGMSEKREVNGRLSKTRVSGFMRSSLLNFLFSF